MNSKRKILVLVSLTSLLLLSFALNENLTKIFFGITKAPTSVLATNDVAILTEDVVNINSAKSSLMLSIDSDDVVSVGPKDIIAAPEEKTISEQEVPLADLEEAGAYASSILCEENLVSLSCIDEIGYSLELDLDIEETTIDSGHVMTEYFDEALPGFMLPSAIYELNLSPRPLSGLNYSAPNRLPTNEVDEIIEKMWDANISFNVPTNANINDTLYIQMLLSSNHTIDELKQAIEKQGDKSGQAIKVKDRMNAILEGGKMFVITAITPEEQAISKTKITEWKWIVSPQKEGQHILYLTLNALLEIGGKDTQRNMKTFERSIVVNVTTTQKIMKFTTDNWKWLWAVIVFPVIGWLWKSDNKSKLMSG